ncbi:MAG: tRNA uridine-5-carboxymethylaminomethyl(34) synthesis enzyme MnmG [Clostridiales Family XIII bacterium]|jgi:tRNA uridine 5-carboxymethylaminomethyl modification enzyme|nr:tRNA uridine-5-carboxymethylaminomethyl(34) synthesis enzyme MnmG [Clostridiales Family XIII bacterium]
MRNYEMGSYDVAVIGAGHAGCEAALAAARLGKRTLVLSLHLEAVALMACNPAIGGTGKGQLVREIDALGGEMGLAIDRTFIQSRMLNRSKGPAARSPRAQADKARYHETMKRALERQANLDLKQGEAVDLLVEGGRVKGLVLRTGAIYRADAVILATGTFLRGRVFIGESSYEGGPSGFPAATRLALALEGLGLALRRFKTGTPARVLAQSLRFERMEEQKGDSRVLPFSYVNAYAGGLGRENRASCWLTWTTARTHEIILGNLGRSALYGGLIKGVGPRYCPSVEDKVKRFPDRERHPVFIEPEGLSTDEAYIQGMSTSMPEDVQAAFYRSIPGLEDAVFSRPGYSIEYDSIDPLTLGPSLEHKGIEGLFCAGQLNGTSGYEEAAAQGLMAGINAALKLSGRPPFLLGRSEAYIGVLIDDLVTKGADEPYRMMTARAEYRLLLRHDNADFRLTEKAWGLGLASGERHEGFLRSKSGIEGELRRLEATSVSPAEAAAFLAGRGSAPLSERTALAEILKRPEIDYEGMAEIDGARPELPPHSRIQAENLIKYDGYIKKQLAQAERVKGLEGRGIPDGLDYGALEGLRLEARQKLGAVRPVSVGQASRVPGVTPADIAVLLVHIEKRRRKGASRDG